MYRNPSQAAKVPKPVTGGAYGSRIPELDGFRGTAVCLVLLYHLFWYSMTRGHWSGIAAVAFTLTKYMWQGVDLFFVLSGFLITGILLDTRADPRYFRNFYMRRVLRIGPVYCLVLVAVPVIYLHSRSYEFLLLGLAANLGPLFGIPMFNGALWSLAVEEHFYFVWPLIVRRLSLEAVTRAALAVIVLQPIIRAAAFGHVVSGNIYIYTWFRLDGLACGALVACIVRSSFYSHRFGHYLSASLLIAGLILRTAGTPWGILSHDNRLGAMLEFVPGNMIFAAAVLWAVGNSGMRQSAVLRNRFLRWAADLSYCIYVIHMMVMNEYDKFAVGTLHFPVLNSAFGNLVLRAAVVIPVCFLIAALSRKYIELPALRLKRFFVPSEKELSTADQEAPSGRLPRS